jgi:hypothetical protein
MFNLGAKLQLYFESHYIFRTKKYFTLFDDAKTFDFGEKGYFIILKR